MQPLMREAEDARSILAADPVVGQFVRRDAPIPSPFWGPGEIRLVVVGQDPTIKAAEKNPEAQYQVRTVLNLDRDGPLRKYVVELSEELGLTLENVYATNACKNPFTARPTTILEKVGVDVLEQSAAVWLPILARELARFSSAIVVSLGEPVLTMLVRSGSPRQMKWYWGHRPGWKNGHFDPMRSITRDQSNLGVPVFPFVHQPASTGVRSAFYRTRRGEYLEFVRRTSGLQASREEDWAGLLSDGQPIRPDDR